jgi:hypothetical protein
MRRTLILVALGLAVVSGLIALLWPSSEAALSDEQRDAARKVPPAPGTVFSSTVAIAMAHDAGIIGSRRRGDERGAAHRGRSPEESKKAEATLIEQLIAVHAIASQAEVSDSLQKNADLAAKEVEHYCEEARKASEQMPFKDSTRQKDAASYLAPRVDWVTRPPRLGTLHLPKPLTDRVEAAGKAWLGAITAADVAGLDFSWMTDLRAFDSWGLTSDGPAADPEIVMPEGDWPPLPNYSLFTTYTKLRLAQALGTGAFIEASTDIHHIADLLHGQGMLISEMVAIHALKLERVAFDSAVAQHLNVSGWTPFPIEDLDRLRGVERYSFSFFWPGVDPKVMKKALSCTPTPCAALAEGTWSHALIGDLSPDDTRGSFQKLADSANCDQGLLQSIRESPSLSVEKAREGFAGPSPLLQMFPPTAKPAGN